MFDEIVLSCTVKETLWVKKFAEIPLVNFYFMKKMVPKTTHMTLSIVLYVYLMSLYFQFCVLHFFVKNSKIEYDPHFWGGENFGKIGENSLFRQPVGRNFLRNHYISHG